MPSQFAWYDMAVGKRAYRLAYLLDVVARTDAASDDQIAWLLDAAETHRVVLADDDRFAEHSNHGFYQAAGQLALGRRLQGFGRMTQALEQGAERFRTLMSEHFSEDGVHLEHSPDYQWMLMQALSGIIGSGLVTDEWAVDLYERIQESTAWLVAPDHRLAMFGDSSPRRPRVRHLERVTNDLLRFVLTGGRDGSQPGTNTRLFAKGGYGVLRDRWPTGPDNFEDCSYLAMTCAFHSRVHKHADDMTFVWYDRGREILTDSGRYGYVGPVEPGTTLFEEGFHYPDPKRVYVESTRAHNTIEIDDRSFPRRYVPFCGSGMVDAGEASGLLHALATRRVQGLEHVRQLMLKPGDWLITVDWLWDLAGQSHQLRQWFQSAPELTVQAADDEQLGMV